MNPSTREDAVAIVGYSHRMPGDIVSDDEVGRLLSEREIVREPIFDRYERGFRPIDEFSGAGRFTSAYEGLIRAGGRSCSTATCSACRTTRC